MQILGVLLLIVYFGGIWKFLAGIHRTNFTQNTFVLALLWPVLLVINKNYRENFTRALKG